MYCSLARESRPRLIDTLENAIFLKRSSLLLRKLENPTDLNRRLKIAGTGLGETIVLRMTRERTFSLWSIA